MAKNKNFYYIGDSFADLVIWKKAKNVLLLILQAIYLKIKKLNRSIEIIQSKKNNVLVEVITSIRVHQWTKNFLLFVPALLSFKSFPNLSENLVLGFVAFSLISSAFYIFNDL